MKRRLIVKTSQYLKTLWHALERKISKTKQKDSPSSEEDLFVDHTVILKPEEAALLFKKLKQPKAQAPAEPPSRSPADDRTLVNLPAPAFDEDTQDDVPALPRRLRHTQESTNREIEKKRKKTKQSKPSIAVRLAQALRQKWAKVHAFPWCWALAFCVVLLPVAATVDAFRTGFIFSWFYLAITLSLGIFAFLMYRFSASWLLFLPLALSAWLLFLILSLLFYSPYDPHALTLFGRPLDTYMHPLWAIYLIIIMILITTLKSASRLLRTGAVTLILYPLAVWLVASWHRDTPEVLFLRLDHFHWLPPLFLQPLHIASLAVIPALWIFVAVYGLRKEHRGHSSLGLLVLLPLLSLFGGAAIYAYHLPFPLIGMRALPIEASRTLSLPSSSPETAPPALTVHINGAPSFSGQPPLRLAGDATLTDDNRVSVPLAIADIWGHRYPFLSSPDFSLAIDGDTITDFSLDWIAPSALPNKFYVFIGLDERNVDLFPQIQLALSALLPFKGRHDELGTFLFGTNQSKIVFHRDSADISKSLLALQYPAQIAKAGFSQEFDQILKGLRTQSLGNSETWLLLFTTQKVLNTEEVQADLAALKAKKRIHTVVFAFGEDNQLDPKLRSNFTPAQLRFFTVPSAADLMHPMETWIAQLYAGYTLTFPTSRLTHSLSWTAPNQGIGPDDISKVGVKIPSSFTSALKKIEYMVDGKSVGNTTFASDKPVSQTHFPFPSHSLSLGKHLFQVRLSVLVPQTGKKSAEEKVYTSQKEMMVHSKSGLQFIYPAQGESVSGRIPIEAHVDATEQLDTLEFYADNQLIGQTSHEPFVYYWNVPKGQTAFVRLSLKARLKTENTLEQTIQVRTGDTVHMAFDTPSFGQYVGRTVPIALRFDQPGQEAGKTITFYLDEEKIEPTPAADAPLHFTWKTPPHLSGKHFLKAIATAPDGSKTSSVVQIQIGRTQIKIAGTAGETQSAPLFTAPALYWVLDASDNFGSGDHFYTFGSIASEMLSWVNQLEGVSQWSLVPVGGKQALPHDGCGDYSPHYRLSAAAFSTALLGQVPQGATPLLSTLRRMLATHSFKDVSRLIIVAGGLDSCDSQWQNLFKSERDQAAILPRLTTRIIVPTSVSAKDRAFYEQLASSLQGKALFMSESGSLSELIERAMSYDLAIVDPDGTPVWNGSFQEQEISLPMGDYRYILGQEHQNSQNEFSLKNNQTVTWTVERSAGNNPPFEIKMEGL